MCRFCQETRPILWSLYETGLFRILCQFVAVIGMSQTDQSFRAVAHCQGFEIYTSVFGDYILNLGTWSRHSRSRCENRNDPARANPLFVRIRRRRGYKRLAASGKLRADNEIELSTDNTELTSRYIVVAFSGYRGGFHGDCASLFLVAGPLADLGVQVTTDRKSVV